MSISVLGGGAFGTALAAMLAVENDGVMLWARSARCVDEINQSKRNEAYLPGVILPHALRATDDLTEACEAETILCVVPAQRIGDLAKTIKPLVSGTATLVLCAKGIDRLSGKFLHQLVSEKFDGVRIAALSGPSFAKDIAQGKPTAVVLAAHNLGRAEKLARQLSTQKFRIYASNDLIGVEAGGALKNVLALAVGIARGLNLGASAEAALMTRGFAELSRLVLALGGKSETTAGLSGLGDLVLTCSSPQSRNFSYGMALGRGDDVSSLPLAEGVATAEMALLQAEKMAIDVPIMGAVTDVLAGSLQPKDAVVSLLTRPLKSE